MPSTVRAMRPEQTHREAYVEQYVAARKRRGDPSLSNFPAPLTFPRAFLFDSVAQIYLKRGWTFRSALPRTEKSGRRSERGGGRGASHDIRPATTDRCPTRPREASVRLQTKQLGSARHDSNKRRVAEKRKALHNTVSQCVAPSCRKTPCLSVPCRRRYLMTPPHHVPQAAQTQGRYDPAIRDAGTGAAFLCRSAGHPSITPAAFETEKGIGLTCRCEKSLVAQVVGREAHHTHENRISESYTGTGQRTCVYAMAAAPTLRFHPMPRTAAQGFERGAAF
jgi:hypothetical protein